MEAMTLCPCGNERRPGQRNCRTCHAEAQRLYRAGHPLTPEQRRKANARAYAHVYLKRGHLERQPCTICGAPAQMHHPDYTQPLLIEWLCPPCHQARHRRLNLGLDGPHPPD